MQNDSTVVCCTELQKTMNWSVLTQQSAVSWRIMTFLGFVSFETWLFTSGVASCCWHCLDVSLLVTPSEATQF
jgi:hypothetical protein